MSVIMWRYLRPNSNGFTKFTEDEMYANNTGSGAVVQPSAGATKVMYSVTRTLFTSAVSVNSSGEWHVALPDAAVLRFSLGSDRGGFVGEWLVGIGGARADMRVRIGFLASAGAAAAASGDPSADVNCIMLAKDEADTNLQVMYNDASGTCTKVDTGIACSTAVLGDAGTSTLHLLFVSIDVDDNGDVIVSVTDLDNPTTTFTSSPITTNLPDNTAILYQTANTNTGGSTSTAVSTHTVQFRMGYRFITTAEPDDGGDGGSVGFAI